MTQSNGQPAEWESQVDQDVVNSVKIATAVFSLARFFYEVPYADTRERFTDPHMAATWPQRDPASLTALAAIAEADESQMVVARDFEALFGPTQLVPGRESTWTDQDSTELMQKMRGIYRKADYTPIRDGALPMDHFAIQLSFLGDRVAKAHKDTAAAQGAVDFYDEHMATYVPQMLDSLRANATSVLYQNVATLTDSAITALLDHCQEIIAASEGSES